MKRKRKSWCGAAAALVLAASVMTVHAEDYTGNAGWAATFTGEAIESNFSSAEIADAVSELQPGDSITIHVGVKNDDSQTADFYITNQVVSSLEDSSNAASGGAYGYRLAYVGPDGAETLLYGSDAVGGEDSRAGEGLHQAAEGMDEFIFLGSLTSGQKGDVSLRVELDGETQGNGYQNTFANLQLNFAVERGTAADNNSGDNGSENGNGGGKSSGNGSGRNSQAGQPGAGSSPGGVLFTQDKVYTGDANTILLWSSAALVSGLGLLAYAVYHYLKKQKQGQRGA